MLSLGANTYVDPSEVVGIFDTYEDAVEFTIQPFIMPRFQCVVILRGGMIVPAYVSAKTVLKRLEECRRRFP